MALNYENIVNMANDILDAKHIDESKVILEQTISPHLHFKLNEELYIRAGKKGDFEPLDVIELEIGGVYFRFRKKE